MTVSTRDIDTRSSGRVQGANQTKAKDRALWVVRAALAFGFVFAGSQKLAGSHQMVHMSPALPLVFLAAAAVVVRSRRHELRALLRLA